MSTKTNTITFTKVNLPYGWLGNMSPSQIKYLNVTWKSSEALFQALRFTDQEIRNEIHAAASPMTAKMKAKRHKAAMSIEPLSEVSRPVLTRRP